MPISCKWVNLDSDAIRSLGIFNSYDTDLAEKLNFLDNLKCLTDVLNLWWARDLSLEGKILVFKSLALSKLLYYCTMKVPSKQLIKQLNIIHKNFVWNNKRPKIKHSTLIASYSEGGYNDIDINTKLSSIKVSWVTRLIDDNFHPWKIIPSKVFSVFGGTNIIFHTNKFLSLHCRKNVDKIPSFYRDLVYLWSV